LLENVELNLKAKMSKTEKGFFKPRGDSSNPRMKNFAADTELSENSLKPI
jgi:hypothetical protein